MSAFKWRLNPSTLYFWFNSFVDEWDMFMFQMLEEGYIQHIPFVLFKQQDTLNWKCYSELEQRLRRITHKFEEGCFDLRFENGYRRAV